jgi:hypothetical protein
VPRVLEMPEGCRAGDETRRSRTGGSLGVGGKGNVGFAVGANGPRLVCVATRKPFKTDQGVEKLQNKSIALEPKNQMAS